MQPILTNSSIQQLAERRGDSPTIVRLISYEAPKMQFDEEADIPYYLIHLFLLSVLIVLLFVIIMCRTEDNLYEQNNE
ncbi:hypothetical protein GCK72_022621 [Caenorhabditis remanei]|uniref:Uncharacterized protein n=1 Tax=Caenorhabditis remanei TaxID=31234 RepID=A0A6A5FU73_CAERE|nr:hypothetical protein GCK72_022621 [Caenorhabditis remanei]KAF1746168.1 hypothetical protein GCK72_022621 [Caenorhabditis remanei]